MISKLINLSNGSFKLASRSVLALLLASVVLPEIDSAVEAIDLGTLTHAQLPGCENFKPPRRRLPALRSKTFKLLEPIDLLVSPPVDEKTGEQAKPNFKAAKPKLLRLIKRCNGKKEDCNSYELAQIYNRIAYVTYALEDMKGAINYYGKVLGQSPNIPWNLEQQALYTSAQLLMATERYKESLAMFQKWEKTCPSPTLVGADYYAMRAQIYYQMDDRANSMKAITKAITMYETAGKIPKEPWFKIKMALYTAKEDYKNALKVMEKAIGFYPTLINWTQISSLYGILNRTKEQRGTLDAVEVMGGLNKSSQARNFTSLLISEDAPYPAAKIMKKYMDKKVVKRDLKNLELLASAYRMSLETDDAIEVMEEAAKISKDSNIYANLSAIYLDGDKFKKAVGAANQAIKRNKFRNEEQKSQVQLYKGVAYLNLENYSACVSAMRGVKSKRYKTNAQQVIQYCEGEIRRVKQLKASKDAIKAKS